MAPLMLLVRGMSFRIDIERGPRETVLMFTGLLDEAALAEIHARVRSGAAARLVLAVGTEVASSCIAELRRLPVPVIAESPFLRAWLESR